MTRTICTWVVGAALFSCSSTTRIHMEEVEVNGGAAGEAPTSTSTEDAANAGGSSAATGPGAGGGASDGR